MSPAEPRPARIQSFSPAEVEAYICDIAVREGGPLARLGAQTRTMSNGGMAVSPDQGRFLAFLVELIGARNCLEIGTFTGYSALTIAQSLPADGTLICCDVSDEWTSIGRPYWAEAGVADKIDLRLAPANQTLDALIAEGRSNSFDFVFIDADKMEYDAYYERALKLTRQGGLIAIDNVLRHGRVITPGADEEAASVNAFNRKVGADPRVGVAMLPIRDGLTLVRKR